MYTWCASCTYMHIYIYIYGIYGVNGVTVTTNPGAQNAREYGAAAALGATAPGVSLGHQPRVAEDRRSFRRYVMGTSWELHGGKT